VKTPRTTIHDETVRRKSPAEQDIARILPREAVSILRRAAGSHDPAVVDVAVVRVQTLYPSFFQEFRNES
jgi:hypothetical protein